MKFFKLNDFSVGKFITEILTIIFGVLLALGVNEMRQSFSTEAKVKTALESIKLELQANKNFLDRRIPYYDSMVDTLENLIQEYGKEAPVSSLSIPGFSGINPPLLRKSSLQTAISTQAFSNIDYPVANNISWVYSFQDTYLKWVYIYFNAFFNQEKASLKKLQNMFREMSFVGKQVNKNYENLLNGLNQM